MKYFKTRNQYEASNVTFNPSIVEARSYNWWVFVKYIGQDVVFNSYPYSNTTIKHQHKVRRLMNELGITIDFEVSTPESLATFKTTKEAFDRTIEIAAQKFVA